LSGCPELGRYVPDAFTTGPNDGSAPTGATSDSLGLEESARRETHDNMIVVAARLSNDGSVVRRLSSAVIAC